MYICITIKKDDIPNNINTVSGKIVGIDFGLKIFITLSDDIKEQSPQYYLKSLNKLRKLQKKLSRKKEKLK